MSGSWPRPNPALFFVSTLWKMEIMKIVLGGFWNNAVLALLMIYTLIILFATLTVASNLIEIFNLSDAALFGLL